MIYILNTCLFTMSILLFVSGIRLMTFGLESIVGSRFSLTLQTITASPGLGLAVGLGTTCVLQSSSAVSIMACSLTSAGTVTVSAAVPVIMGAETGTAITAWITAALFAGMNFWEAPSACIQIASFCIPVHIAILLILPPAIIIATCRLSSPLIQSTLAVISGAFFMLCGIKSLAESLNAIGATSIFIQFIGFMRIPFLSFWLGLLFTAILQSSSAAIGILQGLACTSPLILPEIFPFILGVNIGTCSTAMLGSLMLNRDGRVAALVHLFSSILRSLATIPPAVTLWLILPQDTWLTPMSVLSIAVLHTLLKVFSLALVFPLRGRLLAFARVLCQ